MSDTGIIEELAARLKAAGFSDDRERGLDHEAVVEIVARAMYVSRSEADHWDDDAYMIDGESNFSHDRNAWRRLAQVAIAAYEDE